MEIVDVLEGNRHFRTLGEVDRQVLLMAFRTESHPDGHVLIREGRRSETAFVLLEGEVEVTREVSARRDTLKRLQPGEMFGLIALVDDGRAGASCRARGRVKVASLPYGALRLLLHTHAPLALAFQASIADQLAVDFRNTQRLLRGALAAARAG